MRSSLVPFDVKLAVVLLLGPLDLVQSPLQPPDGLLRLRQGLSELVHREQEVEEDDDDGDGEELGRVRHLGWNGKAVLLGVKGSLDETLPERDPVGLDERVCHLLQDGDVVRELVENEGEAFDRLVETGSLEVSDRSLQSTFLRDVP